MDFWHPMLFSWLSPCSSGITEVNMPYSSWSSCFMKDRKLSPLASISFTIIFVAKAHVTEELEEEYEQGGLAPEGSACSLYSVSCWWQRERVDQVPVVAQTVATWRKRQIHTRAGVLSSGYVEEEADHTRAGILAVATGWTKKPRSCSLHFVL